MNLDSLRSQVVYVAPANPAGNELCEHLKANGVEVSGLIDNLKQGEGIVNDASNLTETDLILVAPGERQQDICLSLRQRGFRQSICTSSEDLDNFKQYKNHSLASGLRRIQSSLHNIFLKLLVKIVPGTHALYLCQGMSDTNVTLMFLAHCKHQAKTAKGIIIDSKHGQHHLGFTSIPSGHWKVVWRLLRAKVVIIDHELNLPAFNVLRSIIPVIQLWHGLPYKYISGNIHQPHVKDAAMVSSSSWYSNHVYPGLFKAENYLTLGHPCNDALISHREARCYSGSLGLDKLKAFSDSSEAFIIYMPTYRDSKRDTLALPLEEIENFLEETNSRMILKMHPFVTLDIEDSADGNEEDLDIAHKVLPSLKGCSRVHLFPSDRDIYPWLGDAAMLITDYSSVVFDYLLCDKPIIYYQYDKSEYMALRGKNTSVPESMFIAGDVALTEDSLVKAIKENMKKPEAHAHNRATLRAKLGIETQPATENILALILSYLG